MRTVRTWLLVFLAVFAVPVYGCAASEENPENGEQARKPLTKEQLWDRYYEYVRILQPHGIPTDREEHARTVKPEILERGVRDDSTFTEDLTTMGVRSNIVLGLDAYTGELRSFRLWSLLRAHPELRALARPERVAPKLTRREVRAIAEKYLPLNTGIELKECRIKSWYEETYWRIYVERCLNGVSFQIDGISLSYSEEYGVFWYDNEMFSEECDVEAKVSKEKAIALSTAYVKQAQAETGAEFRPVMGKVHEPEIMNPATHRRGQPESQVPFAELRKTRLAWGVDYYDEDAGRAGGVPRCISLYIDAITGELLGYDTSY